MARLSALTSSEASEPTRLPRRLLGTASTCPPSSVHLIGQAAAISALVAVRFLLAVSTPLAASC